VTICLSGMLDGCEESRRVGITGDSREWVLYVCGEGREEGCFTW
jgi:hypothetical protein